MENPFGKCRKILVFQHFLSKNGARIPWLERTFLGDGQSLHEPPELLNRQLLQLPFIPRPLESHLIQALVKQDVPRAVPIDGLNAIRLPSAEQINGCFLHLTAVFQLNLGNQPIDLEPHVRVPGLDEIILDSAEVKHGCSAQIPILQSWLLTSER